MILGPFPLIRYSAEDYYSDSEVDQEGNLRDFISDDIEYTDYSSSDEEDNWNTDYETDDDYWKIN